MMFGWDEDDAAATSPAEPRAALWVRVLTVASMALPVVGGLALMLAAAFGLVQCEAPG
jgi:hypothetical protein